MAYKKVGSFHDFKYVYFVEPYLNIFLMFYLTQDYVSFMNYKYII